MKETLNVKARPTPVRDALWLAAVVAAVVAGCGSSAASKPPEAVPTVAPPIAETASVAAPAPEPAADHSQHAPGVQAEPAEPQAAGAPQDLLAEEKRAFEAAQPVFEKHCVKCHASRGARSRRSILEHLSMDSYPFGGHHAHEMGAMIRDVLGVTGEEATMPDDDPGAVKGEELALVVAWTQAFDRSHAAGLHQHGEQGHGGHKH